MALVESSTIEGLGVTGPSDRFVVFRLHNGRPSFSVFRDMMTFWSYMQKLDPENRTYYETVRKGARQKPRFDIDILKSKLGIGATPEGVIGDVIFAILSTLAAAGYSDVSHDDIIIYSSHGDSGADYKYSYHIVLPRFYHCDNISARAFYDAVKDAIHPRSKKYPDAAVYGSTQEFRIFYNTKYGQNRPKVRVLTLDSGHGAMAQHYVWSPVPDVDEFLQSLLTYISPSAVELKVRTITDTANKVSDKVELSLLRRLVPHGYTIDKYYHYGYRLIRVKATECLICYRVHDNDGGYIRIVEGMAYFRCWRDDKRTRYSLGSVDESPLKTIAESIEFPMAPQRDDAGIQAKIVKAWEKFTDDY